MSLQMIKDIELATNPGIGINLYFALKQGDGSIVIRKADLAEGDTQKNLKDMFVGLVREDFRIDALDDEEISVLELSTADERNGAFYHYDLEDFPENFNYFLDFDLTKQYETFTFETDDLIRVEAFLLVLGTQENYCILYKKFYPVCLLGRGSFCLFPAKQRFEEFDKEVLRVTRDYQFIRVGQELYVKDLKVLEKFGGFRAMIEKEAESAITAIENMDILEESDVLKESIEADISFARKLCKIRKTSPIIEKNIPNDVIINFSRTHPGIKGKLKYSEDEKKILLTTKKSQKVFLNLLDDSFLTSELTKEYYTSLAKDNVRDIE